MSDQIKEIGNYQYNEKHCLGEGAYGKVFQAINTKTGETVAIKKLDLNLFERDQYLRNQIVHEIEILKKFDHPNIVKFCDLMTTQRSLYIVTEMCKDGDLKERLLRKRVNEEEVKYKYKYKNIFYNFLQATQIMIQIINGFKELVRQGVIHRDLKPANILNHEGTVKIADFGFAKYVDNYSSQLLRSCVGSPLYMAPQVLSRKCYSTKCDIWSLGVIFYEMVFHDVPWKGRDEQNLLSNILSKPLVYKNGIDVSATTKEFLRRALTIDEAQRMSWDDVFTIFDQSQNLDGSQTLTLSFRDVPDEGEAIQKIPNWMNNEVAITNEVMEKQLKVLVAQRQEIAFKHFVCIEITMKYDTIKSYVKKEYHLDDFIALLSKSVIAQSTNILNQLIELCDLSEHLLVKGTKWNILNQLRSEHNFYQIHYDDFKEVLQRTNAIQHINQVFLSDDLNEDGINRLNDTLNMRAQSLVQEITDELSKRTSNKGNLDVGKIADYIVDVMVIRKRLIKSHEIDYSTIHLEKSSDEDSKKVVDRTLKKLKQSCTL